MSNIEEKWDTVEAFFGAGRGWNWKLFEFSFIQTGTIMPITPFGNFETKECKGQRALTGQKKQNQQAKLFRRQYLILSTMHAG